MNSSLFLPTFLAKSEPDDYYNKNDGGATRKIPYGVDVFITLTSLAPHFFLLGWSILSLILLLDQLKLG